MEAEFEDFEDMNNEEIYSENSQSDIHLAPSQNVDFEAIGISSSPRVGNSEDEISRKEVSQASVMKDRSRISDKSSASRINNQFNLIKTKEVNSLLKEYEEIYHTKIRPLQFLIEENKIELQTKERDLEEELENEFNEIVSRLQGKKAEILSISKEKFVNLGIQLENYSRNVQQNESLIEERINVVNSFKEFQASSPRKQEKFIREFCEFKELIEDPNSLRAEIEILQGKLKKVSVGVNYEGLIKHIEEIGMVKLDIENLRSSFKESVDFTMALKSKPVYNEPKFIKEEEVSRIPPWSMGKKIHQPRMYKSNWKYNNDRIPSPSSTNFLSPSKASSSFDRISLNSTVSKSSKVEARLINQQKSFVKVMSSYRSVLDDLKFSARKASSVRRRIYA